ncbi:MAG: GGDEF domain-containing protein, partial [Betaproteobacteria bacterium]|nr:GGDEF domain-containing protein [Betaproteobacteria bacterium]
MSLDVRTIMLVLSTLTLMFSGLLALAGKYSSNVKGVGHWALASLFTAIGFGFSYSFSTTSPSQHSWPIILASVLIASGISLQYCGLQRFKDKPVSWRFAILAVGAVLFSGVWFTGIHNNVVDRAIVNSIIFAILFAACSRELLIPAESPLKIAYWLTGASFCAFSVLALVRAAILWQSPAESYGLFQNIPINPLTFLGVCLLQFCTMFGFILMLDYRLVGELDKLAS